ncbi:MAG: hypothetical protein ACOC6S_01560 [Chloroflexota bacterium]
MTDKTVTKVRNQVATPCVYDCRLCEYTGYAKICEFLETGKCAYQEALKVSRRAAEDVVARRTQPTRVSRVSDEVEKIVRQATSVEELWEMERVIGEAKERMQAPTR